MLNVRFSEPPVNGIVNSEIPDFSKIQAKSPSTIHKKSHAQSFFVLPLPSSYILLSWKYPCFSAPPSFQDNITPQLYASEMLYRDVNGKRTTTFGSLKYLPTASDPYSVTKWTPVFPDKKDLKMKGFYNIFHKPDAPYAITKIWGWIEYTALKETKLTMTLYISE